MTIEEYAKSNFRFLNLYQAMLFISNGVQMKGTYISYDPKKDDHKMIYVFEKNKETEEMMKKFQRYELKWGDNVIVFNSKDAAITIK